MSLERLRECVNELSSTNSANDKLNILIKYDDCKDYFFYAFNPYYRYGVTSNTKTKDIGNRALFNNYNVSIFELLNDLKDRIITGHDAIFAVRSFVEENKEYEDLIYMILDKNIEVRMGASQINKVWPNLIPEFKVCLAKSYGDFAEKVDFEKDDWYCSRKLDGVRLITTIDDNGNINFYSREGNEFTTLDVLKQELSQFNLKNITLDGELCIVDDNEKEDFKSAVSQIKRKDYTIQNPKYKIFDILPTRDFREGIYHRKFSERLQTMISFMLKFRPKHIETVRQIKVESVKHLNEMMDYATSQGWEGLIIKRDIPYVAKRSNDMLKVKKFIEDEYVIVGIETDNARVISSETGLEETIEVMARANILHKGNIVGIGSGWSLDERKKYRNNPELLVGKQVTVSYFEESQDKDGKLSLRFPTIKHIWEEGERNV